MIKTEQQLIEFMDSRSQLGFKPGLERVQYMLQSVGHPEKNLKAVHIAGTNGKGSVIQFMQEALTLNGYRTGVFSSPSFIGIKGHFLTDGIPANESEIINAFNQLIPVIEELDNKMDGPTEFEIITVAAFIYFSGKIDITLIETGMGGRYDTTNSFQPLLSIITSIAKDHMEFLGDTIEEIAFHKAGIIKQYQPVIVGQVPLDAEKIIIKEAVDKKAPSYRFGKEFKLKDGLYQWEEEELVDIPIHVGMKGKHQLNNASLAFSAIQLLKKEGFKLNDIVTLRAFANVTLPGRFEQISYQPYIVLDSAHNTAGISAFIETTEETKDEKPKVLLFASFKDKQPQKMVEQLKPYFEKINITTFQHKRAASIKEYNKLTEDEQINFCCDWKEAVRGILDEKESTNKYYITGSLSFITVVREYIVQKQS